jgi:REP element-mobilizing transposase RayT
MARPLRIQFPGGVYHVTARGNGRQTLFVDDVDHEHFLDVLADVVAQYHLLCHAYCLMANHYHLLLETPDANLSRAMRQINGLFARYFNRRYERPGHVLQGRFHAQVVDRDAYLREACRYIVLNPVRAGLVAHPRDWAWSSYRATAGEIPAPAFLTVDWLLSLGHASSRADARRRYTRFVIAGMDGESTVSSAPPAALVLGSARELPAVRAHIERSAGQLEIPREHRFALRPPLDQLFAHARTRADRDACCARAAREHGYSLREIARFLGIHYSAVSRAVGRGRATRLPEAEALGT